MERRVVDRIRSGKLSVLEMAQALKKTRHNHFVALAIQEQINWALKSPEEALITLETLDDWQIAHAIIPDLPLDKLLPGQLMRALRLLKDKVFFGIITIMTQKLSEKQMDEVVATCNNHLSVISARDNELRRRGQK